MTLFWKKTHENANNWQKVRFKKNTLTFPIIDIARNFKVLQIRV